MNLRWFGNMLVMVFMVMVFIYIIKWAARQWNIPVVSQIAEGV